jgi:uncharacterized membrane protein
MAFCAKCGKAVGTGATATVASQSGLAENVAGLLCYVLGWITGLIFFLIDKRPSVRFHAAQSMVVFGALHIVSIALHWIFGVGFFLGGWTGLSLGLMLARIINLVALVLWIVLMVKAYQGQRFEVPIAAGIAQSFAGR